MDKLCNEFIEDISKNIQCTPRQRELLINYFQEKNIRIKGNKVELLLKKTGRGRPRKGIESIICDKVSKNSINDNNLRIVNVNEKNLCDGLGVEYELATEEYI